ncbi:MAG: helix-turn-helix domain-containing protein [Lachnospiraceae bacterium]|nr:helix-turn-helix domain-containing protein [Lachnospiraceae bacterium]
MEFNEKLQELRKARGLTQEELAEALFVSRTAISKWESGRGYPSIDSLKQIANYFSISIDELLSGERLITIAENENRTNLKNMGNMLFGVVDIFSFIMIILPLYPNKIDDYIYSVNLFNYTQTAVFNLVIMWSFYLALILIGISKILLTQLNIEKGQKVITNISLVLGILAVLYLAMTRDAYAITVVFVLLIIKVMLLFKVNER